MRAYAYLLVDKYKTLTLEAHRRLEAIQEASELGSGFRIAMQDLEIRGAGELLGARQHGHIAAVGFDLYTRLLAQAIQDTRERVGEARRKAREAAPAANGRQGRQADEPHVAVRLPAQEHYAINDPLAPTVTLDLNIPAVLPESYVPEAVLRLQLYRRLAGLNTMEAIEEIGQEFIDRFGPLPEQVENLLYVVRVKVLAINAGVESIGQEDAQLLIKAAVLDTVDRNALQERVSAQSIPARVARRAIWLPLRENGLWRRDLMKTLDAVRQAEKDAGVG